MAIAACSRRREEVTHMRVAFHKRPSCTYVAVGLQMDERRLTAWSPLRVCEEVHRAGKQARQLPSGLEKDITYCVKQFTVAALSVSMESIFSRSQE